MKKLLYVLLAVTGIGLTACKDSANRAEEVQPPKHLPAYYYGNADYFNELYNEMYNIVCQIDSDEQWQSIIYESLYNNNYDYTDDLIQTATYQSLNSLVTAYMGMHIEELDPEMSSAFLFWADSLANTPYIDEGLRTTIFSDMGITEYDVISLCIQCAFMYRINEQLFSCSIVITDGNEAIDFPVKRSDVQQYITTTSHYTAIEIQVNDFEEIPLYSNVPLHSLPSFLPYTERCFEYREAYNAYYISLMTPDEASAVCDAEYDRQMAEAERDLNNKILASEYASTTSLRIAQQAMAYSTYHEEVERINSAYLLCKTFAVFGISIY